MTSALDGIENLIYASYGEYDLNLERDVHMHPEDACDFCLEEFTNSLITDFNHYKVCDNHYEAGNTIYAIKTRNYEHLQYYSVTDLDKASCCVCKKKLPSDSVNNVISVPLGLADTEQFVITLCDQCKVSIEDFDDLQWGSNIHCERCKHNFQVDKDLFNQINSKEFEMLENNRTSLRVYCRECVEKIYGLGTRFVPNKCTHLACKKDHGGKNDLLLFPPASTNHRLFLVDPDSLESFDYVEIVESVKNNELIYEGYYMRKLDCLLKVIEASESECVSEIIRIVQPSIIST